MLENYKVGIDILIPRELSVVTNAYTPNLQFTVYRRARAARPAIPAKPAAATDAAAPVVVAGAAEPPVVVAAPSSEPPVVEGDDYRIIRTYIFKMGISTYSGSDGHTSTISCCENCAAHT